MHKPFDLEAAKAGEPVKTCFKCKSEKPHAAFYKRPDSRDGLYATCKVCRKLSQDAWNSRNKEKVGSSRDKWATTNRDKVRENQARWVKENPEKMQSCRQSWVAKNPEKLKQAKSIWYRENKPHCALKASERRRLVNLATPGWANRKAIKELQSQAKALTVATGVSHDTDHIVPIKSHLVCGLHWEGNIQVMPSEDNGRKGNTYWPDMPSYQEVEVPQ